jgi:hypothetical protein
MKKTIAVICSMLTAWAAQAQVQVVDQSVPNKVKAPPVQEHVHVQRQVHVQQPQTHPAFYRRSTAGDATFNQRLHNQQVQTQNHVYTRGQVQHFNLSNAANPRITSARFNAGARINGSERWQGQHYDAFRSYHSQWHDHNWWRSHHTRIVLIGGGYYYWDAGFWYPAWGYDPYYSNYDYDGPVYGYEGLQPDEVIANVQAALQQLGYYAYIVDGVLGSATEAAIANYQRDNGLSVTGAIDPITVRSLGLSS